MQGMPKKASGRDGANANEIELVSSHSALLSTSTLSDFNVFQSVSLKSHFALESRFTPPGGSLIDQAVDFVATSNTCR
jgi:hypothetical protein